MIKVRPLTDAERHELQRGAHREVARVSERMRMILLSSRGYLVGESAANRLHGSMEALVSAVHAFFASFTPEDALRLTA